jgi:pimeloyl-ACP methyl ester carboxylesterase
VTTQITPTPQVSLPEPTPLQFVDVPLTLDRHIWQWRGHRICYSVQGEGRPIILVHGFGASIGHWRKNIPLLAAAGYRVFALDLLGFGASDKAPVEYSVDLWVDLLKDFWTEQVRQPAVFVGNSIGALITLKMLADAPEMASAGVLLNAAGGLNHRPEELNPPLRLVMGMFTQFVSSPIVGNFVFNQVRRKSRIKGALQQVYCDRTSITPELVELLYEPSCDPGAQAVFASILTAPAGPKPEELLPQITQPLLVLWGEADPWTPIAGSKIYQELADREGDRVQFIPIPKTGHCPHDECPQVVNPAIVDWLNAQENSLKNIPKNGLENAITNNSENSQEN